MSSTVIAIDGRGNLDTALEVIADRGLTVEDRAGAYSVLYTVQLRINRALKKVRDELILHMERNDLKALGPLTVKSTAIDVAWPCNDPGNWGDAGVQDTIRDLYAKAAPDYVRLIPQHYEIDTRRLGEDVHLGDPVALQLHAELKAKGWRTEQGRRLSLAVKEVK